MSVASLGPLSAGARRALAVTGGWALVALLAYVFVFSDQLARADELRARRQRLAELRASLRALADQYELLVPADATGRWVERVVPLLERVAAAHQVKLANLTPQAPRPGRDVRTLAVTFGMSGAYADLAAFVADLERTGVELSNRPGARHGLLRVRELELSRAGADAALTGSARLESYAR